MYRSKKLRGTKSKSFEAESLSVNDLPALRRKRTLAFNRLTKTLDIARLAKDDVSHINKFLTYYSEVQKLVLSFEEAHADILSIIDSDSEESEDVIRSEFDDHYFEILGIRRQLTGIASEPDETPSRPPGDRMRVELPKINLPNFSGNIKAWPEFYDVFNSIIHKNNSLSDTERMHYLVSSLSGDALALIRTFPVTGSYYDAAYKTLVERYRDKRDLAFTCWKEMLNVNFKTNSPHEFRRTLDTFNENLTMLTRLDLPTDKWDFVLTYLLLSKMDTKMRCSFEQLPTTSELPTYASLKNFLYSKCDALVRDTHFSSIDKPRISESSRPFDRDRVAGKYFNNFNNMKKQKQASVLLSNTDSLPLNETSLQSSQTPASSVSPPYSCSFCGEGHSIIQCKSFAQKSPQERFDYAKQQRWCFNCLKSSHGLKECKSIFKCQKCHQRHHTLLHLDGSDSGLVEDASDLEKLSTTCTQVSMLTNTREASIVLLSTAKINIRDSSGNFQSFRALIDSGSQAHFITDRAANRLGLSRSSTSRTIRGLGQSPAAVSGTVNLEVGVGNSTVFTIEALTLPNICSPMPSVKLDKSVWKHIQNLALADPDCNIPGNIDVLLGAQVFSSILLPGSISGGSLQPSALNSIFGWVLLGNVRATQPSDITTLFISEGEQLNNQVKQFWELDSIPPTTTKLAPDEELCEKLYLENVSRDVTGRYIVALPFKEKVKNPLFPGSREAALKRFHSLERKLVKNPELLAQYSTFMADYLHSGHMSLVPLSELPSGKFYIPHHCVLRPDSVTTKLRVVFDASAKDARNVSLNETLLIGPKLQANVLDILCRFRIHPIVFTADVRQMYRQIVIAEDDRDFQRIFWRFNTTEPVQEYQLNTVTYGVASAPFLACRTIKQLADDEGADFPVGREVLKSDVYVDDVVSGAPTLEEARQRKTEVISLLQRGQFELRKWASNRPELLTDLPSEHCLTDVVPLDYDGASVLKVLGLKWNPFRDVFTFEVRPLTRKCTKRTILSELARIFDPLGFLSPLTFVAKCFIQKLWILAIDWDATPPKDIVEQWDRYSEQLHSLRSLEIPRCLSLDGIHSCQIHGFSDSSEAGYGAVTYLRVIDSLDRVHIFFLCAKSRVAPIQRVSLPRLELCAASLLADLLKYVKKIYSPLLPPFEVFAWSDSTVALSWIKAPSYRWKTFVANRVSHIQDALPNTRWNHVPSGENPADIASRGQFPADLINNSLWWVGPNWLTQSSESWPSGEASSPHDNVDTLSEERAQSLVANDDTHFIDCLLDKYSSIRKIQRIIAYCRRFMTNCKDKSRRCALFLSRLELHDALLSMVKHVQSHSFNTEIMRLKQNKILSKQMRKLNLFIDESDVLRVGGRLSRSGLEFEHKYPALLPRNAILTYRIIEAVHHENHHPGLNTMHYLLTQQFWILSPKRAIYHCLSKCIRCYRVHPNPLEPFMSDLPATRVNQVKPFSIVGVDYGGPFRIKLGKHRGAKIGKAYLCLFVCFTTKALHLETVSDLSSEAFIAALRRFVGRRGRVSIIYSDCGTNFIGANNLLNDYTKMAAHAENIEFRFNIPSNPHAGGVWEIQIKAVKTHLYRVVGDQALTFEELTTLFIQIEAMLNSRPLYPVSSDPNDLNVLTPGHFLTLEPLTSVPDEDLTTVKISRLGRWQLIQRFQQDFWKRWKTEYLQSLTQRAKWTTHCKPLDVNSIVIIKTENTTPLHWPLARVIDLHPGPDGIVRSATIRTANGSILKRPLVKLCPLPMSCD